MLGADRAGSYTDGVVDALGAIDAKLETVAVAQPDPEEPTTQPTVIEASDDPAATARRDSTLASWPQALVRLA
ncbi:MAG: hypothetical protein R2706_17735 [Acidimicrobiales bacterium]